MGDVGVVRVIDGGLAGGECCSDAWTWVFLPLQYLSCRLDVLLFRPAQLALSTIDCGYVVATLWLHTTAGDGDHGEFFHDHSGSD